MPRRTSSRVVVNRKALSAIRGGFADGLAEWGAEVIAETHPPDATPFGEGLVTTGDWGVWSDSRKVAGTAKKPRAARTPTGTVTLLAGFGFPGWFQERGTVHQPARPFFEPVLNRKLGQLKGVLLRHVSSAMRQVR